MKTKIKSPKLVAIDLDKRNGCNHPDIKEDTFYLAIIDSCYFAGVFTKESHGWIFSEMYDCGVQFDDRDWQGLWEIK